MLKVVSNTTPIISLLKIDKLILFKELYNEIIIPKAVFDEIENGKNKDYYTDIKKIKWITIEKIKNKTALNYFIDLDAGEAETIILANEINADLVIIDELIGRQYAKKSNLKLTGSLGVLLKAKQKGLIEKIEPYLSLLVKNGIWIDKELFTRVLKLAKEN